jgi:ammonia channel protein AmtB
VSAAVAGAWIAPASGCVLPWHGVVIGTAAGAPGFSVGATLKHIYNYDGSRGLGSRRIDAVAGFREEEREELDSRRSRQ